MSDKPKKEVVVPSRLVLIEWDDACAQDRPWVSGKKLRKQSLCRVHTVGYVVTDDPEYVTVCNSVIPSDGTCGGDNTIPRGMIKKITELKS